LSLDSLKLPGDNCSASVEVDVLPGESENFSTPQAENQHQNVCDVVRIVFLTCVLQKLT